MKKPDVIMAIDQSLNSTGIAIFYGTTLHAVYNFKTSEKEPVEVRMEQLHHFLCTLIKQHKPTIYVLEDVYMDKSIKSFRYNLFIQGMVFAQAKKKQKNLFQLYPASTWRKLLGIPNTGKRKDKKAADKAYVKALLGLLVNDDIADAICIGLAYIKEFS